MCLRPHVVVELLATCRIAADAKRRIRSLSLVNSLFRGTRLMAGLWHVLNPRQRAKPQTFERFKTKSTIATSPRSYRDYQVGTRMGPQKFIFEAKHVEGCQ